MLFVVSQIRKCDWNDAWLIEPCANFGLGEAIEALAASSLDFLVALFFQKLILRIWPPLPTNHPAFGVANATAQ